MYPNPLPTVQAELERNDDGTFVFIASETPIEWPLLVPNTIGSCSPDYYGFYVYNTGGGCTAWRRDFTYKGESVHMLLTDEDATHDFTLDHGYMVVGVYGGDEGSDWFVCWEARLSTSYANLTERTSITSEGDAP